ncbi:MAG: 7-cyano-7-deazaguanine synthase QueC [Hyphomonadaceae bacterium]|jgi:7-cyano-7-deazaguanine synthase|nr:7-cyano-7-deazaguanine synthase QueC [Hyphomonadaceae bacterium]
MSLTADPALTTALVLFSGGQDSTACLAWALERYGHVETVGFDYGQRHRVELDQRLVVLDAIRRQFPDWSSRLGDDHLLEIPVLGAISDTALTSTAAISVHANGLPNTFVPGRNLIFLTLAGALAWRRGASVLVGGMCETDYSGYPDCRRETLDAVANSLQLGMELPLTIETPLMDLDKAQTWALAMELGGPALVAITVEDTHTCYLGDRTTRHDWGLGCGTCPACELRARGWQAWKGRLTAHTDGGEA